MIFNEKFILDIPDRYNNLKPSLFASRQIFKKKNIRTGIFSLYTQKLMRAIASKVTVIASQKN